MSVETQWFLFTVGLQVFVGILRDKCGYGYITRFLMRLTHVRFIFRTFFRLIQITIFYAISDLVHTPHNIIYWLPVAVLYIDDLFYRDNNWWKKRKEWVKNKIKWKQFKHATVT